MKLAELYVRTGQFERATKAYKMAAEAYTLADLPQRAGSAWAMITLLQDIGQGADQITRVGLLVMAGFAGQAPEPALVESINAAIAARLQGLSSDDSLRSGTSTLRMEGGQDFVSLDAFLENPTKEWCLVARNAEQTLFEFVTVETAIGLIKANLNPYQRCPLKEGDLVRGPAVWTLLSGTPEDKR